MPKALSQVRAITVGLKLAGKTFLRSLNDFLQNPRMRAGTSVSGVFLSFKSPRNFKTALAQPAFGFPPLLPARGSSLPQRL